MNGGMPSGPLRLVLVGIALSAGCVVAALTGAAALWQRLAQSASRSRYASDSSEST